MRCEPNTSLARMAQRLTGKKLKRLCLENDQNECLLEIGAEFLLLSFMNDANPAHFRGVFMNKFIIHPNSLSHRKILYIFNERSQGPTISSSFLKNMVPIKVSVIYGIKTRMSIGTQRFLEKNSSFTTLSISFASCLFPSATSLVRRGQFLPYRSPSQQPSCLKKREISSLSPVGHRTTTPI